MERIPVYVYAGDPISQAGVASGLRPRPELLVVGESELDNARVAVVVTDALDEQTVRVLLALQRGGRPRVVLVATEIDDKDLVKAVEAGVSGLVRRAGATPQRPR